mgnify:CR=1 FL=1
MKKKVISLFVTGMLAVSMIAGCGSDNTAADAGTTAVHPQIPQQMLLQMQQQIPQQRKHRQLQQTLMQVNMSMYYPARMDQVQEVHSSNYSESKKKTQTEIKWTTQQRKRSSQTAHP